MQLTVPITTSTVYQNLMLNFKISIFYIFLHFINKFATITRSFMISSKVMNCIKKRISVCVFYSKYGIIIYFPSNTIHVEDESCPLNSNLICSVMH